ncbi:ankyrin, partial [Clathrospora elynae]
TPLHLAIRGNHSKSVCILLSSGADPNLDDYIGNIPIHFAAHSSFASILIAHGEDISAMNNQGQTPLQSILHSACLIRASWKQDLVVLIVNVLLDHGADLNAKDGSGATSLLFSLA